MTISRSVYNQLFEQAPDAAGGATKEKVIRLRPTEAKAGAVVMSAKNKIQMWTKEEHERFLAALEKYPAGPWKKVADFIGTKTPRQTMTHAQKYRQKIHRRQRGLRNQKKSNANANANPTTTATGAEGQATTQAQDEKVEGEKKEEKTETKTEEDTETEGETETKAAVEAVTETKMRTQTRPEDCKCNCSCSAHGGKKSEAEDTTTQLRPDESK
ncbi:ATP-binding Cassette (ABC) superfamily [Phytophthora nicotianae]|uniref:ATP-binding Cassette (ABC) superfamily n=1 Tax=Phytophthora nicotianae TaxID=4792 RepID=A0A0W8DJR3_PHYNI|nr:ATP-binding Cassette (ABC) superfamily [Phytophthora nicotianae]